MLKLLPSLRRFAEPTRRQLLRWAGWSVALVAVACRKREEPAPTSTLDLRRAAVAPPPAQQGKVLNPDEWRALESATARILPSDDGPGAREANVIRFIDDQLTTQHLAPLVPVVRAGAALLDKWARAQHGSIFALATADQQDAILHALAAGSIPVKAFPQKEFFRLLHNLTLEGFLSDPVHGGNADMIGWKTIGFAEPHRRTPDDNSPHGLHHK
jgi:gluconate 2-dehydrogenase subunit 3-like protein